MKFHLLPYLSCIIFAPLIGAIFLMFGRGKQLQAKENNARAVALWVSFFSFFLSLVIFFRFNYNKVGFQFVEDHQWFPMIGLRYQLGVDGISLLFVLLTTFIFPLCILSTYHSVKKNVRMFIVSLLILETMILGSFLATDVILFYIFFEGVLIPMFFLIGIWGGPRRLYATFKFFLYTLTGSVLLLLALLVMCWELQTASIPTLLTHSVPRMMQLFLWPAFFIGFAIKLPLWPFHTWLPDAHVEAPTAGSVILAAVLLKMGGYGMIRFMLPLLPDACQFYSGFAFALGAIAVFYTSLVALAQSDMKKLIAYSSVAHMAFIVLGCFSLNPNGVNGAMVQMISHGFTSAALFFCVGVLYDRVHSREINDYRGIIKKMPYFSGLLLFFTLASIGVPGTSGFVGEILVLIGIYPKTLLMTTVAGTGMIFGAAYMLWLYKRIIYGEANDNVLRLGSEIYWKEAFILIALMIPTLFFGFYPKPILDLSANFVGRYTTTQPPFGQPSP